LTQQKRLKGIDFGWVVSHRFPADAFFNSFPIEMDFFFCNFRIKFGAGALSLTAGLGLGFLANVSRRKGMDHNRGLLCPTPTLLEPSQTVLLPLQEGARSTRMGLRVGV